VTDAWLHHCSASYAKVSCLPSAPSVAPLPYRPPKQRREGHWPTPFLACSSWHLFLLSCVQPDRPDILQLHSTLHSTSRPSDQAVTEPVAKDGRTFLLFNQVARRHSPNNIRTWPFEWIHWAQQNFNSGPPPPHQPSNSARRGPAFGRFPAFTPKGIAAKHTHSPHSACLFPSPILTSTEAHHPGLCGLRSEEQKKNVDSHDSYSDSAAISTFPSLSICPSPAVPGPAVTVPIRQRPPPRFQSTRPIAAHSLRGFLFDSQQPRWGSNKHRNIWSNPQRLYTLTSSPRVVGFPRPSRPKLHHNACCRPCAGGSRITTCEEEAAVKRARLDHLLQEWPAERDHSH
jgi:hypothetical protein